MTSSNVNKYALASSHYVNINKKPENLKLKMFFSSNYKSSRVFRGLQQLSNLFWRRVMAISKVGVIQPQLRVCRGRNFDHFLFYVA